VNAEEAIRAGLAAEEGGDFVGAAAAFGSLLEHPDARVSATARFHLGRVVWKQGRHDEALALCEQTRAVAIRLNDDNLRAQVENAIGVLHVARGEYAQARAAYDVALKLSPDIVTRAKITLNLGVIANIQGKHDLARKHYAQSLMKFREAKDHRGEALALHNIGMLHADHREWDEAEEAFRTAVGLFELQGNRQMIANVLVNRSEVGFGRGRVHEALAQCDLALEIYAELGDEIGRGEALRWKGYGLRILERHHEAEQTLAESVRIAERTHTRLLEAEALRELGLTRKARGEDAQSRRALERALELFRELDAHPEVEQITNELRD
jgi:tetratricopeptide (TPR) repeat protein